MAWMVRPVEPAVAAKVMGEADRHQAAELLRRRRADQRAPVRRQQSQMAGRVAAVPLARLGVGIAVAGQPVEPASNLKTLTLLKGDPREYITISPLSDDVALHDRELKCLSWCR